MATSHNDNSYDDGSLASGSRTEAHIRVLIADDEPLVREMLRDALAAELDVEIVSECRSGTEALEAATQLAPDVLFLDIRMPGLNGLEVAARLTADPLPLVVFVTAYDAHAVQAFELNALDYLLKPFDVERVRTTLQRVRERLRAVRRLSVPEHRVGDKTGAEYDAHAVPELKDLLQRVSAAIQSISTEPDTGGAERFLVTMSGRMRVIESAAVEWIEADGNYARLHLAKGSALLRETMKSLEARLSPRQFVRVHRSALVRVAAIRELEPTPNGDYRIHLLSGATVAMSRSYRDEVVRRLAHP